MSIFDKFFSTKKANTIEVAHGKERYDITFPDNSIEDGTATVGELRSQCTYVTNTPNNQTRLLFRGKNLVDDAVPLRSIGMKSGSKVLCMATAQKVVVKKADPSSQLTELMAVIQTDLAPQVHAYTTNVPTDEKTRKETHDKLAELLLQKLFALDGVVSADNASDANKEQLRTKRKEAVKYTQGLLDSVDGVMNVDAVNAEYTTT